jgi:outer membrane receptor protein involved in Fe transport
MITALLAILAATPAPTPTPSSTPVYAEEVTVVASRFELPIDDAPASVAVVGNDVLSLAPGPAIDDTLRQVPGFSLFRRSGSRTANPTSQGVSLRGVGASGASRAVVLCDGVPLGDPFGGWVYWSRVPRAAVDRVEILRGGGSSLYGSGALGGAVRLFRREPNVTSARVEASMASQSTPEVSAYGHTAAAGFTFDAAAEYFRTDGYVIVDPAEQGNADAPAWSRHKTGEIAVGRGFSNAARVFLRASLFDEKRGNGTPLQVNDTQVGQGTAGLDAPAASGHVTARAFWSDQDYHQTFSTVAANRASEVLNRIQDVSAPSAGAAAEWLREAGRHRFATGIELRHVRGTNAEVGISGTIQTPTEVGARQQLAAAFAEDRVDLGRHTALTLGLRIDEWRNDDARRVTNGVGADLAPRSEGALSPRAALVHEWTTGVTLMASAYRAFRAPTLNELYRSFRVGNVSTAANEALTAEHLTGLDLGLRWSVRQRLTVRATAFRMDVDDPVANVTLRSSATLIERQRQNLGASRSQGVELDAEWRLSPVFRVDAGYLFVDARVRDFPADTSLEGLRLPQVPRHSATLSGHAQHRIARAWIQARFVGAQFDDDVNKLTLGSFVVVDGRVERGVRRGAAVFVAAENLFDVRYDVGRTPNRTVAPPRSLRAGLTLDLSRAR